MAELTYDEVKRATGEATRNIQEIVAAVRSSRDEIRRNMQQLDNMTFRLNSIQTQLNVLQQQLNGHMDAMRPVRGASQSQQAILNQQIELNRRVAGLEQIMRTCYNYLSNLR